MGSILVSVIEKFKENKKKMLMFNYCILPTETFSLLFIFSLCENPYRKESCKNICFCFLQVLGPPSIDFPQKVPMKRAFKTKEQ